MSAKRCVRLWALFALLLCVALRADAHAPVVQPAASVGSSGDSSGSGSGSNATRCVHEQAQRDTPQSGVQRGPFVRSRHGARRRQASMPSAAELVAMLGPFRPLRLALDVSALDRETQSDRDGDGNRKTCYRAGEQVRTSARDYTCKQEDVLTSDKAKWLLETLLPRAEKILEESLEVRRPPADPPLLVGQQLSNGTVLARPSCGTDGGAAVPFEHAAPGFANTDLVIYVTARPILQSGVLAFASFCVSDVSTGRPVAGHLNYSPSSLSVGEKFESQLGTTLHEMSHVLGFSQSKFDQFFDPDNPLVPVERTTVIKEGPRITGTRREVIATPKVREYVRQHFDCDSLAGGEIEDGGGSGTTGSHWEKRVFFNEYMTGSSSSDPIFSELTMAYFEDSGWYKAAPNATSDIDTRLLWGKSLGCDFAEKDCNDRDGWPRKETFPGYYCTDKRETSCSFDLKGKARCGLIDWSAAEIPNSQRYFGTNSGKGGLSQLADFCPYFSTTEFCTDESIKGSGGEKYGRNSLCLANSLSDLSSFARSAVETATTGEIGSNHGCFEVFCTGSRASPTLKLQINGLTYDCPAGKQVEIEGKGGAVQCPPALQISLVCETREIDNAFPEIASIEPAAGPPGTVVTITGKGFKTGFECVIDVPVIDTEFVSETTVKVTVAGPDMFRSPEHLTNPEKSVILTNPDGRSTALVDGFSVEIELGTNVIKNLFALAVNNPMNTAILGIAFILAILCCVYCCCSGGDSSSSRKSRRKDYKNGFYF